MDKDKLINSLKIKGYNVEFFNTSEEAVKFMTDSLSNNTIGIGGSMTVKEIGLDKALQENNKVYWHWIPEQVEKYGNLKAVRDLAQGAEIYISSSNAVAETGQIVNIDGSGNRIASIAYGHKKVYFIIGINKVTENLDKAMWRARNISAPINTQRLNRKTPCAKNADKCYDCSSPDRICNGFLILERPMSRVEMTVILVNEDLGT